MNRSRLSAGLILALIASVVLGALPVLAQDAPVEVFITEVGIARYPEVTLVVELRNIESLDPSQLTILEATDRGRRSYPEWNHHPDLADPGQRGDSFGGRHERQYGGGANCGCQSGGRRLHR